jgi:hypothetical protein
VDDAGDAVHAGGDARTLRLACRDAAAGGLSGP